MPWMGYLQLSKSRSLHLIRSNSRPATRAHKVRILGTYRNPRSLTNRVAWSTKTMALRLVQFLAIMLTALALVPSGAHLAALPNKIAMAQAAYFVAQQICAGCALFGIVLSGALIANLVRAIVWCASWADHSVTRSPHFCYCCQSRHLLRLDLPDKSSDQQLDRCA